MSLSNGSIAAISAGDGVTDGASGSRNSVRATGLTSVYFHISSRLSSIGRHAALPSLFARQSRVDPLTDLANRRHFAEVLSGATRNA